MSRRGSKKDKNKTKLDKPVETAINIDADINDDQWNCLVTMVVERDESNSDFILFFQEEAKKNIRPVIKGLTFETILQSAKKGRANIARDISKDSKGSKTSDKSKKSGSSRGSKKSDSSPKPKTPTTEDIVGSVLAGLKKDQIPSEPLAKLIKQHILSLKQSDIDQKRILELQLKEQHLNRNIVSHKSEKRKESENKSKKDKKGKEKSRKESKSEKKENKSKDKEKPSKNKTLKKGLEINDHPPSGPDMYIVLSGFYDPELLISMVKVGIPVRSIIVIESPMIEEVVMPSMDDKDTPRSTTKNKKTDQSKKIEKIVKFWEDISVVLNKTENQILSKDLPMIKINPSVSFKTSEQKNDRLSAAYNEMSSILYKIYEYWRLYEIYFNNMKIIEVKKEEEILLLENAHLYNSMIVLVPLECCSVEIILHCILEQVSRWESQGVEKNRTESLEKEQLGNVVHEEIGSLQEKCKSLNEEETKALRSFSIEFKNSLKYVDKSSILENHTMEHCKESSHDPVSKILKYLDFENKALELCVEASSNRVEHNYTPVLIDSYDSFKNNTFHLNNLNFNIDEIFSNIFKNSSIFNLWKIFPEQDECEKKLYDYHMKNFRKYCEDFYYGLDYFFNIYLHQMLLKRLISFQNNLATYHKLETDDPFFSENFNSEVLNCGEIVNELVPREVKEVDTVSLAKEFGGEEEIKMEVKDKKEDLNQNESINLLSHGFLTLSERQNLRDEDMKHLRTFLECTELRNLYDENINFDLLNSKPVKDEVQDLLFLKELDSETLAQTLHKCLKDFSEISYSYFPLTDCIIAWFNQNYDSQHLNHEKSDIKLNTLVGFKYFYHLIILEEEKLLRNLGMINKIDKETNTDRNDFDEVENGQNIERKHTNLKTETNNISTTTNTSKCKLENEINSKQNTIYCYDLESKYCRIKESVTKFFSPKGTNVQIKKMKGFQESLLLSVKIEASSNVLSFYQQLPIDQLDLKLNFKTYNDIIISADVKQLFRTKEFPAGTDDILTAKPDNEPNLLKNENNSLEEDCGLKIVLPTGLSIEFIKTSSQLGPYYVKQKYLDKHCTYSKIKDEDYRCYLRNGSIIIYKLDQTVDILYNNSTVVKCKNFRYVLPVVEPIPEPKVENKVKTKKDKKSSSASISKKSKKKEKDMPKKSKEKPLKSPKKVKLKEEEEVILPQPVLKLDTFILSALGECLLIEEEDTKNPELFYTLRTAYDPYNFEFYTFRSDGTSCLFSDENLVVSFPDGSRISSICEDDVNVDRQNIIPNPGIVGNAKKLFLDIVNNKPELSSTVSEKESYILNETGKEKELLNTDSYFKLIDNFEEMYNVKQEVENNDSENTDMQYNEEATDYQGTEMDEEENIFGTFDVVKMDCILEHENYATVHYKDDSKEIFLKLPGDVTVVKNENEIKITVETSTTLTINKTEAVLTSSSPDSALNCFTLISLDENKHKTESGENENTPLSTFLCGTCDADGNVLMIDKKGEVKKVETIADVFSTNWNEDDSTIDEFRNRYFVLRRDLSGYELIKKDHPTIYHIVSDDSVNKQAVSKKTDFLKYLYQEPIVKSRSDIYVMKQDKILPIKLKRKDLTKPKIYDKLWIPEVEPTLKEYGPLTKTVQDSITPIYSAFSLQYFLQIKKENLDIEKYFNEGLSKYISKCNETYNKYKNHTIQDIRTEEEVLNNAKLIFKMFPDNNQCLKSDQTCSLCGFFSLTQHSCSNITPKKCPSFKTNISEAVLEITEYNNLGSNEEIKYSLE